MKPSHSARIASLLLVVALPLAGRANGQGEEREKLSLSGALEIAHRGNPRMAEARSKIDAARGKRITESTFSDPEAEFEIGGLNKTDGEREPGLKKFAFLQEFDPPAVLWLKSRIARHEIAAEEESLKAVWAETYGSVRDSYYAVLLNQKECEVAEDNLTVLRRFLDRVTQRFQAGEVLLNDLQRAKIAVLEGENLVLVSGKDVLTGRAALNLLLGRGVGTDYDLVDTPEYRELKGTLDGMLSLALRRRPDLARAKAQRDARDKALLQEKFSVLPAPSVAFERSLEDYDNDYKILLGFSIPFWNWKIGETKRARAERDIAENELFALTREAGYDVYKAFLEAQLADKQLSIAGKALEEGNELLRLAELRYGEGELGYLEYMDQVKTVMATRLEYHRGLFAFNRSVTKLEQATYSSLRGEDYLK